jgi:broad-specificity NMP kinase
MSRQVCLVILTGASGAGKTALVARLRELAPNIECLHFDSKGVPSLDEMIRDHGSPESWQRARTREWINEIGRVYSRDRPIVFEGQMRIAFVRDALNAAGLSATIVLVDCDDAERRRRLIEDRGQPELATDEMLNWAAFLRREAQEVGARVLDTTSLSKLEAAENVREILAGSPATGEPSG